MPRQAGRQTGMHRHICFIYIYIIMLIFNDYYITIYMIIILCFKWVLCCFKMSIMLL